MAINPTLPPTVEEFRNMFPEFSEVSDEMIQLKLDEGMRWVDTFWYPVDAKFAVMYASAHYLSLQNQASGGALTSGDGSGGGGVVVDPEVGKIWIKTVRFRDRMVSYERVNASNQAQSGGQQQASADDFWESTPYGTMYLSYRRRNVPHIAVI